MGGNQSSEIIEYKYVPDFKDLVVNFSEPEKVKSKVNLLKKGIVNMVGLKQEEILYDVEHAVLTAFEAEYNVQNSGSAPVFSRKFMNDLLNTEKESQGRCSRGIKDILQLLKSVGAVTVTDYENEGETVSQNIKNIAEQHRIQRYLTVLQPDVNSLRWALTNKKPVMFAMNIYSESSQIKSLHETVVNTPKVSRKEKNIGTTAGVIIGYNDKKEYFECLHTTGIFRIKYSCINDYGLIYDYWVLEQKVAKHVSESESEEESERWSQAEVPVPMSGTELDTGGIKMLPGHDDGEGSVSEEELKIKIKKHKAKSNKKSRKDTVIKNELPLSSLQSLSEKESSRTEESRPTRDSTESRPARETRDSTESRPTRETRHKKVSSGSESESGSNDDYVASDSDS